MPMLYSEIFVGHKRWRTCYVILPRVNVWYQKLRAFGVQVDVKGEIEDSRLVRSMVHLTVFQTTSVIT